MNLSGLTKTLGSAFMQMAMMTTSLSAGATPSGYYSGRRGGYSSGKNKSYLVDPSIKDTGKHRRSLFFARCPFSL
jgi:hypothetical protein